MPRKYLIEYRQDTAANWASINPVLESGEPGYDTTNKVLKVGDGATAWNSLATSLAGQSLVFSKGGPLSVYTGTFLLSNPRDLPLTLIKVKATVGIAPQGDSIVVDVKKNGVSIFSSNLTRPVILSGSQISSVGVPNVMQFTASDNLTVDILQVGTVVRGGDLTVTVVAV